MIKFISSLIAGIALAFVYEIVGGLIAKQLFNKDALVIFGYKLHHSLYGLISLGIFAVNKNVFFLGFGIGIIIQHTLTDGFRFIQKM